MKKRTYSEMKDSGVDIIDSIPISWEIMRLKFLCKIMTGDQDTQDAVLNGIYPFYVRSPIVEKSNKHTFEGEAILMAGDGVGAGKVFHHAFGKIAVHQRVYCLFDFHRINSNFFYYYIGNLFPLEIEKGSAMSTVVSVRLPMLKDFFVVFPKLEIQTAIANYLDAKCAQIDEIISEIQKSIEEYKKWKSSIIFEAVTKGLDPNVEMKDSGVEWIGKIPKDFILMKLKYVLSCPMAYGASESGVEYDSSLPRYIRITDIDEDGKLKDTNKLSLTFEQAKGYILQDGTILFARSGATVGKTFLYTSKMEYAAFAGYLISAIPDKGKVISRIVYYYTNSSGYVEWCKSICDQATIQNIGAQKYGDMPIVIPRFSEQTAIADYLDNKCAQIDEIISEKEALISDLELYKKSLIYEVVTGKIRVS